MISLFLAVLIVSWDYTDLGQTGFHVECALGGAPFIVIGTPGPSDRTFTSDLSGNPGDQCRMNAFNDTEVSLYSDTVTIPGPPPPPPNQPPVVDAGTDIIVTMPAPAILNGSVTDDGLPFGSLIWDWRAISGPNNAQVMFSDTNALNPSVTFSRRGTYTLRLTASDGELISSDDVTVHVRRR